MRTKGCSNRSNVTGYCIIITQLPPWAVLVPLSRGRSWGVVLSDGVKLAGIIVRGGAGKSGGCSNSSIYTYHTDLRVNFKDGYPEKQGVLCLSNRRKKNKSPQKAIIENGLILCPKCGALLGKAYYDASCKNIELWCRGKDCRMPVYVEL